MKPLSLPHETVSQLVIRVIGVPVPQGSKSISRTGRLYEANPALESWRRHVATVALATSRRHRHKGFTGPVLLIASFTFVRPESSRRLLPSVRPDLDKLMRAIGDALQEAKVVGDDSQFTTEHLAKRYGATAGVKIILRTDTLEEPSGAWLIPGI